MKQLWTLVLAAVLAVGVAVPVQAQNARPLRMTITDGVIEPLAVCGAPVFEAETATAAQVAADISRLVAQDLARDGAFPRNPVESAFITVR